MSSNRARLLDVVLAMFDGVYAASDAGPVVGCNLTGIFQDNSAKVTEAHLTSSSVQHVAKDPLLATTFTLDEAKPLTVFVLARRGILEKTAESFPKSYLPPHVVCSEIWQDTMRQ